MGTEVIRHYDLTSALFHRDETLQPSDLDELLVHAFDLKSEAVDGITSIDANQFHIDVRYQPLVISVERLDAVVSEMVTAAADVDGLFPYAKDKVVRAVPAEPAAPESPLRRIVATCNTQLARYKPQRTPDLQWDRAQFVADLYDLAWQLSNLDGVVGIELNLNQVELTVDTTLVTVERVQAHIDEVLHRATLRTDPHAAANKVFPFLGTGPYAKELRVSYEVMAV